MILLTGSNGFVGKNLINAIPDHEKLTLIDKNSTNPIDLSYIDLNVKSQNFELIIHLAAAKGDFNLSKEDFYRDNVLATKGLIKIAENSNCNRIIHYSTVSVYGHYNNSKNENAELNPNSTYGATKLESEKLLIEWANKSPERSLVILRPSVIYGINNYANMYNLMTMLKKRFSVMIGNGNQIKSMVSVNNIVDITMWCLDQNFKNKVEIFNCTEPPHFKLNELINIISSQKGYYKPKVYIPIWIAKICAFPVDILSRLIKIDLKITVDRINKVTTATDYRSLKLEEYGYQWKYDSKDEIIKMANWINTL
ncbi:MAG: NAD-dependent epimerase/dehydratase family protein [Flavobacteriaceae bacterium]